MRSKPTATPCDQSERAGIGEQRRHCRWCERGWRERPTVPLEGSATKEQLPALTALGPTMGVKWSVPAKSVTSIGRERPQCSFKTTLARMPGPSAKVSRRKTAVSPPISMRGCGTMSLPKMATAAGAESRAINQRDASRECCTHGSALTLNVRVAGLRTIQQGRGRAAQIRRIGHPLQRRHRVQS